MSDLRSFENLVSLTMRVDRFFAGAENDKGQKQKKPGH
jgi:hypothetical protein